MKTIQKIKMTAVLIFTLTAGIALKAQSPTMAISHNPTNLHTFFLDVLDMDIGVTYGVAGKTMPDAEPFNVWTLLDVFSAPAAGIRYDVSASSAQRTYLAVNLDNYVGAALHFVSPAPDSVLSGNVGVQLQVTDILPLLDVEVFVGSTLVGSIQAGHGGLINLPTQNFPNGEHQLWARVVNEGISVDLDEDSIPDSQPVTFQSWASVSVTFSNEVYMENFSPLYSSYGISYFASTPHDYLFEVFRLNGELLHTNTGTIDGTLSPSWDFTDLNNAPVNDAGYVFSLTATLPEGPSGPPPFPTNQPPYIPPGGGNNLAAAGAAAIRTTNFFDKGVTVGKYVISYGEWPSQSRNEWDENLNSAVSYFVNVAAFFDSDIIGEGRETHAIVHADFTADPYVIRRATQTNDLITLTNALGDTTVGSWQFDGHSGHDSIIPGVDGHLIVRLTAAELAGVLGNTFSHPVSTNLNYNRRLFSTFIIGCSALNGYLPIATGTPPGVNQADNPLIRKNAFVGFSSFTYPGQALSEWSSRLHAEWIDGVDYSTPLWIAVNIANTFRPTVAAWGSGIQGFESLVYTGEDAR